MLRSISSFVVCGVAALFLIAGFVTWRRSRPAQLSGRVVDSSGAVIPNASVTLISETRGTKSAALPTNTDGDYVFPNVAPDTYTVEVTATSFKVMQRTGVVVSGADRVGVPAITLTVGGTTETVTVAAEATLVQSQSGERSFAVTTTQIESLPIARGNFTNLIAFTPGVKNGGFNQDGGRLGGASQDNLMMDGISAMDTGNNGQMINMNIESIGEIKVLTQGYQAEYGRSSGLQITAVTKSGTNQFHGSGYAVFTDSDWNKNSWVSQKNGDAKSKSSQQTYGYTIGGPVRIPKVFNGRNKLFFFYAHEFRAADLDTSGISYPVSFAVGTRARRQLLPKPRQQRRTAPPADRLSERARPSRTRLFRPAGCMPLAWRCSTAIRSRPWSNSRGRTTTTRRLGCRTVN